MLYSLMTLKTRISWVAFALGFILTGCGGGGGESDTTNSSVTISQSSVIVSSSSAASVEISSSNGSSYSRISSSSQVSNSSSSTASVTSSVISSVSSVIIGNSSSSVSVASPSSSRASSISSSVSSSNSSRSSSSFSSASISRSSSSSLVASSSSLSSSTVSSVGSSSASSLVIKSDPDFGVLTLVDAYHPAMPDGRETASEPVGTAVSQQILGKTALVLPPENVVGTIDSDYPKGHMQASYTAFVMGKNKVIPGQAYVLEFDYPDDVPRQITFLNRGADLVRTVATGREFGDYREQYAFPNPESLAYHQSNEWKTYRFYFTLHDRFQPLAAVRNERDTKRPMGPADGFWVAVGGFSPKGNPINTGAAVGEVRLYSVNNTTAANLQINLPPNGLPYRRTFWREEMNDSTALCLRGDSDVRKDPASSEYDDVGKCNPATGTSSGTTEATWLEYKMKLSKVLGFNVFTKDLLEFGFNQGFTVTNNGGNSWYHPSRLSYWDEITIKANSYGLEVLPYMEYYGAMGGGSAFTNTSCPGNKDDWEAGDAECRAAFNDHRYACETFAENDYRCRIPSYGYQNNCQPLLRDKRNYTEFAWAEVACIDVSDPDALTDAKKLLNATVLDIKDNANFAGAWFRTRVGSWPISFRQEARNRYAADRNVVTPTRAQLRQNPTLRQDYQNWFFEKRREFLLALRDYLRNGKNGNNGIPNASILFTSYHEEGLPVPSADYADAKIITDDTSAWSMINSDSRWQYRYSAVSRTNWLNNLRYDNMLFRLSLPPESIFTTPPPANEDWKNNSHGYATPPADPLRYTNDSGVLMTMPFGKQFTLDDPALIEKFKNQSGLAMMHHFPLNEDDGHGDWVSDRKKDTYHNWPMSGHFGYFVSDVERATPYTMLAEVRALAEGDAFWLGYLSSNSFNTGAPQDLRRFNQAYLAWPAVASTKVTTAVSDPEVIVREISTASQGKFVAVFNTGMTVKTAVQIDFTKTTFGNAAAISDRVSGAAVTLNSGKLTTNLQVADFRVFYLAP